MNREWEKKLTVDQQEALTGAFLCEKDWRRRILSTVPASEARSALMKQMYEDIQDWSIKIDGAFGRIPYFSAPSPSETKARSLNRLCLKGKCLEIGAGGGALCWALGLQGWRVEGIDLVRGKDWSKIMAETYGRVDLRVGDIKTSEFPEDDWDLIIMEECLEHIPPDDYEMVLKQVHGLLKRKGWVCVVFPNALTGPCDVSRYFVPRGAPAQGGHFNERSFRDQARDLSRAGFKNLVTVAYGSLPAGRRLGWSRLWYYKACLLESLAAWLPPNFRLRSLFPYAVPSVLAGQKR